MSEEFKKNVELFISILREEKDRSKELSELRTTKKRVKEEIRQWMLAQELDEATVPNTATLTRVPRKRVQALKRQAVESWARQVLGGDERSLQEVGKLYDSRDVKHIDDLVVQQA